MNSALDGYLDKIFRKSPGCFPASWSRASTGRSGVTWGLVAVLVTLSGTLRAVDDENCLMCHRFRGLARVEKDGTYRLFYVDEELFSRGPHARVSCKGCHADIDKIPHDNAKRVDCLRECHVEEPNREILFSHSLVQDILDDSVHGLTESGGSPKDFPDDLPRCKGCHDEPLFRPVAIFKQTHAGVSERALSRCELCHEDKAFVRYFYLHVTTRLHKARDPREVVAMCGSCHANPALARRHGLPDVVSSYLETYHGKAVLFGSRRAPDCMDCHIREGESVHAMHSKQDPRSSVHSANRGAMCSTNDCHPGATHALAGFHVHADRNSKAHLLEYLVALMFVMGTLAVLLPVLTLRMLGLVRELLPSRRAEADVQLLNRLAEERVTRGGEIVRFGAAHRAQHAFLVICFVLLCLTGFPLKFPETAWAPVLLDLFGGIEGAPVVHRIAGVTLLVGFGAHLISILHRVRRLLTKKGERGFHAWRREIAALPLMPRRRDWGDFVAGAKYLLFLSPRRPRYGRFSWEQKLEYLGLFWGIPLLGVTGVLLWAEELSSQVFPGALLNVAYLAHTYESLLAAAHITLVHLPGIIGKPGASPISGMITGRVPSAVMAEEHGGELEAWGRAEARS